MIKIIKLTTTDNDIIYINTLNINSFILKVIKDTDWLESFNDNYTILSCIEERYYIKETPEEINYLINKL